MASYAGATSRRSHTKSRKGCKTCKRRHIRCDETFPQCRNCSKHQVRCDYMDSAGESHLASSANISTDLYWSSEVENVLDSWQRTGHCTVGDSYIDLQLSGHVFSKSDLHLIYQALWSGGSLDSNASKLTVWAGKTPRFLEVASESSYLLHAMLGFGSLALAWERNSSDAKALAYQQGAIALQGLQTAISNFSKREADAVLAASILLSWQANDWRSWVSLVGGIRTVLGSMRDWRSDSRLQDQIDEFEGIIPQDFYTLDPSRQSSDFLMSYTHVLRSLEAAFDQLATYTIGRDDHSIVENLKDYVQRLLNIPPAQQPEEQFHHLYALRKWLFWLPPTRLRTSRPDALTLVVLAHLYATPVALEQLFPEVGPAFCASISVQPLENVLQAFDNMHENSNINEATINGLLGLTIWPQQIISAYRARQMQSSYGDTTVQRSLTSFETFSSNLANASEPFSLLQPSPAFTTSASSQWSSEYAGSNHSSPYVELPTLSSNSSLIGNERNYQSPMLPSAPIEYEAGNSYYAQPETDLMGLVSTPLSIWA